MQKLHQVHVASCCLTEGYVIQELPLPLCPVQHLQLLSMDASSSAPFNEAAPNPCCLQDRAIACGSSLPFSELPFSKPFRCTSDVMLWHLRVTAWPEAMPVYLHLTAAKADCQGKTEVLVQLLTLSPAPMGGATV